MGVHTYMCTYMRRPEVAAAYSPWSPSTLLAKAVCYVNTKLTNLASLASQLALGKLYLHLSSP